MQDFGHVCWYIALSVQLISTFSIGNLRMYICHANSTRDPVLSQHYGCDCNIQNRQHYT